CSLSEIAFYGILMSDSTATDLTQFPCNVKVSVNGASQTVSNGVNYRQDSTPQITSISPDLGTAAGGTTLTITGTGFSNVLAETHVLVDETPCTVTSVAPTQIQCTTSAAPP